MGPQNWPGRFEVMKNLVPAAIRTPDRSVRSLVIIPTTSVNIINIYYISTVNTQHMKNQMFYYNWVIPGDMFRPLNGHLQANLE